MRALLVLAMAAVAAAQPLKKPLAEFDRAIQQLSSARLVGDPVTAGSTTIVPFAAVQFSMAAAAAPILTGGGLGGKVVPLGMLIVDGDDVRLEAIPEQPEPPGAFRQLVQALLDKKLVFMVNGLNVGNLQGTVQDLGPLMNGMLGGSTVIVNGLNAGSMNPPKPAK